MKKKNVLILLCLCLVAAAMLFGALICMMIIHYVSRDQGTPRSASGTPIATLEWTKRLGGLQNETSPCVTTDAQGQVYVAFSTESKELCKNWPGGGDHMKVSVNCLSSAGETLWSDCIGGSSLVASTSINWSTPGALLIWGHTESATGFSAPREIPSGTDIDLLPFLCKIGADGHVIWTTFSRWNGTSYGGGAAGCAVDPTGVAYTVWRGFTDRFHADRSLWIGPRPPESVNVDGVLKVDSQGDTSSFICVGGEEGASLAAVAVEETTKVYVVGTTMSDDLPADGYQRHRAGSSDFIIMALSLNGHADWITYFGGTGIETTVSKIAVAHSGGIIVGGYTDSPDIPVTNPNSSYARGLDGIVSRWDRKGSLLWSRYLGGRGQENIWSVLTDKKDNIYVVGDTNSSDFPTRGGYYINDAENLRRVAGLSRQNYSMHDDGFITILSPTGNGLWSAYLGGDGDDKITDAALDNEGNLYVVGITDSAHFPGSEDYGAQKHGYGYDVFIAKYTIPVLEDPQGQADTPSNSVTDIAQ